VQTNQKIVDVQVTMARSKVEVLRNRRAEIERQLAKAEHELNGWLEKYTPENRERYEAWAKARDAQQH
jgi:hypothetical protein